MSRFPSKKNIKNEGKSSELSKSSNVEMFISQAQQLQQLLSSEGLFVRVAKGDYPDSFAALTSETQSTQLGHFVFYVDVCAELKAEGESLQDSQKLILKMISKMGLRAEDDLLEKIKDHHIVEIYNKDNIQTFRNLNFFAHCSYSLDELLSEPWWKLFHREDEINRQIFYHGATVLSGDRRETFCPNIPSHILEEINSPRKYRMYMNHDFITPLYKDGQVEQALVIETARLLA